jgi:hypothetical protein
MKTPLRLVKEMSGEALQLMSTALGIHLAFWAWVASEQASDGFWLNTHSKSLVSRIYLNITDYHFQMMVKFYPSIYLALNSILRKRHRQ